MTSQRWAREMMAQLCRLPWLRQWLSHLFGFDGGPDCMSAGTMPTGGHRSYLRPCRTEHVIVSGHSPSQTHFRPGVWGCLRFAWVH